jgi:hypothetical protein
VTYRNDPVIPRLADVGLVARSGAEWYRVGGWRGVQPLVWIEGQLQMFNTNEVVEVVYDPALWKAARGL